MAQQLPDDVSRAAGAPYRRARSWAWTVFWLMAGTSVLYNVYHALVISRMPWYTGIPEGVVPLVLAIGTLEIAAACTGRRSQAAAYAITAGAMAWSAAATGAVVDPGAPGHLGWPFGVLADAAALFAMHFILNGPKAAAAVAEVVRREAELRAGADAERAARVRAEAAAAADVSALRDRMETALAGERTARENADEQLAAARSDLEKATARAEALMRKQAGPARRSGTAPVRSGTGPRAAGRTAPDDDLELESRALKLLATDLEMSGAELARRLGISEGYGRKLRRRLGGDRSPEAVRDRPEDRSGTADADRGEDRS